MAADEVNRYAGSMTEPLLKRSPELMSRGDTALLVVDVQEKLMPLIPQPETIIWNIRRLLDAARVLELFVAATEQYPQGLGSTVSPLANQLGKISEKTAFSCTRVAGLMRSFSTQEIKKILVVGIETHVCIAQTALDLLAAGLGVYVAADAVGSRSPFDRDIALRRMETAGAVVTTTEAVLFEWCEIAGTPEFKLISQLVCEAEPGAKSP
jgi:nicotinamidase-related amidase